MNVPRTTITAGPTTGSTSGSSTPPSGISTPHAMVMIFENRNRSEVIGNREWPFLNELAGRYGNTRTTSRNLTVVRIDTENNLILVRGGVPGPNGGLVMVRPTKKIKR